MENVDNSNLCVVCNKKIEKEWRKDKQHIKKNPLRFCSSYCSHSKGKRTDEFKNKVRQKLLGKKHSAERLKSRIESIRRKGIIPTCDKPNLVCKICKKDTGSPYKKSCSKICYSNLLKLTSTLNPKCGGQKHTHRSKISNINNEIFVAESSYEVKLSNVLNKLNILWVRPNFFWYKDKKNQKRRYYPDFYLPKYDLYLDPKNDFLIKTDIDKIKRSAKQNKIRIAILSKNHLNDKSINILVGDNGNAPLNSACKADVILFN
jgi:hypothetical protein